MRESLAIGEILLYDVKEGCMRKGEMGVLRKIWNTLRHGERRTKIFLYSVMGLFLATVGLIVLALVLESGLPFIGAAVTGIIFAATLKDAVLSVKKFDMKSAEAGPDRDRKAKAKKKTEKEYAHKGSRSSYSKEEIEELEEFGEGKKGKKKEPKKEQKKEAKETALKEQREQEDAADFGENAMVSVTEEKLKRLLLRYKVKQEHVPVVIDLCIPEHIRQLPGFAWTDGGSLKILLIDRKPRMLERPLSALQEMTVERGITVKASTEYVELRESSVLKKAFSDYLPRYQKKEVNGRTLVMKNLYVLDEDIKFTSNSVNELRKLFPFRINVPDRRLEMEGISPYYKEIFVRSFLWRDGILTLEEYRQEVERVLTELASPQISYGEFETTLSAMISSGLLPAEYRSFANARREEAEKEEEGKKGKRRSK